VVVSWKPWSSSMSRDVVVCATSFWQDRRVWVSEFVLEIGGRVRNVKAREIEGEASVTGKARSEATAPQGPPRCALSFRNTP
jgi:hypothetical protein